MKAIVNVGLKKGVLDDQGKAINHALGTLGFKDFTTFAEDRGIVVVDTKFEIFVDEDGKWVLGDEVLTPESSRFIALEDFKNSNFISMDKQILRDFGKKENWKEQSKSLKSGEKLAVVVPKEIEDKILSGYKTILERLSK